MNIDFEYRELMTIQESNYLYEGSNYREGQVIKTEHGGEV